ncbi:MAG: helix-turn-helix domain-containing protein [Acidimicrobiales bacterium]
MSIHDPSRYLLGGTPRSVVVPARISRLLDRAILDDYRRRVRGMDTELDAALAALHEAGLEWVGHRATSGNGSKDLPQIDSQASLSHEDLDVAAVALQLGCTDRNVTDLCARGHLAGRKVRGRWLVTPEALDGFITQRKDH